ncbi:MAG: hypothetical protein E7604_04540 [Ruminococcaceae bacterium]|nr:hypothetical protein [Oscillospiraceae bacterium]
MNKLLFIAGITGLIAGALSLLLSAFFRHGYYHVLDGSADLYMSLHQRMIVFLVIGIVLAAVGIASMVIRAKL